MKIKLHRRSEPRGLDATISARYDRSVARQWTSFPLRHWNLRNRTLQTGILPYKHVTRSLEIFFPPATSLASRLRTAGSLAVITTTLTGSQFESQFNSHLMACWCDRLETKLHFFPMPIKINIFYFKI